jgi:hypothetical protein
MEVCLGVIGTAMLVGLFKLFNYRFKSLRLRKWLWINIITKSQK